MHFVGFALKPLEKVFDAVPLFIPVTFPTGFAMDEPSLFLFSEFPVRNVHANVIPAGEFEHIVIAGTVGFGHPGLHRTAFET